MRRFCFFIALFAVGLLLYACTPDTGTAENELPEGDSLSNAERGVERLVYSLPPPAQVLGLLKASGARYEKSLLNPDTKASRYTSSRAQALNLGVYSADLAFASTFEQNQDALRYYLAVQKLAQPLGVGSIFSQELAQKFEANKNDADAIATLAADAFRKANALLKANGQPDAAALILVGGWVEGLHIATGLYKLTPSTELGEQIALQKHALPNVLALFRESGAADTPELAELNSRLTALEAAFAPISFEYTYSGATTDSTQRMTRIDNQSTATFTPEMIDDLVAATTAVRTLIVD